MDFRQSLSLFFFLLLLSTQSTTTHKPHNIRGPIKTVVVLIMENRSFDHILGWLTSTRPKIDGLTGKESNRLSVSDPTSPKVHITNDAYFIDSDLGHSFQAIREQIFDRWFASVLASTQPNRFYVHSATSHDATSNIRKDLIHDFPQKTTARAFQTPARSLEGTVAIG